MTEAALIAWLEARASDLDAVGPLALEAFDERDRLLWRGFYQGRLQLTALLQQLRLERDLGG